MSVQEQFQARGCYTVIPRTLVFLRHAEAVLLLRGAPTKRLWAGRYNGLGGHLEPDESLLGGALREIEEEAGIPPAAVSNLQLRALINLSGTPHGVLLAVFVGWVTTTAVSESAEGTLAWLPVHDLHTIDLVDGDQLLPRLLATTDLFYGYQQMDVVSQTTTLILQPAVN